MKREEIDQMWLLHNLAISTRQDKSSPGMLTGLQRFSLILLNETLAQNFQALTAFAPRLRLDSADAP